MLLIGHSEHRQTEHHIANYYLPQCFDMVFSHSQFQGNFVFCYTCRFFSTKLIINSCATNQVVLTVRELLDFMFFVLCIVIQLCNVNQQNALFKLMFSFNSSFLLRVSNILCSSSARKTYHIRLHVQYSLPDDERKMFETCRRQEKLN